MLHLLVPKTPRTHKNIYYAQGLALGNQGETKDEHSVIPCLEERAGSTPTVRSVTVALKLQPRSQGWGGTGTEW